MQINSFPNKFEIYQEFYFEINGEEISYEEALELYFKMDAAEKSDFETYYRDETGYEIIDVENWKDYQYLTADQLKQAALNEYQRKCTLEG